MGLASLVRAESTTIVGHVRIDTKHVTLFVTSLELQERWTEA